MSIHNQLCNATTVWGLAFSVQDVDHVYEYVMALRRLTSELAEIEGMEVAAPVSEYEDESGYYILVNFNDARLTLNYIDLFIDMMNDPEVELDLHHLQLLTYDIVAYQRLANAKEEHLRNCVYNLIEDLNEYNVDERLVGIEQVLLYNHVDKLRPMIQAITNTLESNGIQVGEDLNTIVKQTIH